MSPDITRERVRELLAGTTAGLWSASRVGGADFRIGTPAATAPVARLRLKRGTAADARLMAAAPALAHACLEQAAETERLRAALAEANQRLQAISAEAWGFDLPTARLARLIAGDADALTEPCTPPRAQAGGEG